MLYVDVADLSALSGMPSWLVNTPSKHKRRMSRKKSRIEVKLVEWTFTSSERSNLNYVLAFAARVQRVYDLTRVATVCCACCGPSASL